MQNLIINPLLSTRTFENAGKMVNIQLAAPKKLSSLKIKSLLRSSNEEMFNKMINLLKNEPVKLTNTERDELVDKNILIQSHELSEFPKFFCKPKVLKNNEILSDNLIWNDSFSFNIPKDLKTINTSFKDGFKASKDMIWIKDVFTQVWWPYTLEKKLFNKIRNQDQGILTFEEKLLLSQIGLLIPKDYKAINAIKLRELQETYKKNNSIIIHDILNVHIRKSLVAYYKQLEAEGFLRLGDFQSYNRYWAHNDNMNRFLQAQIYPLISQIVQESWKPAFSYYVAYKSGASLKKHIDRSQASLSLSLLLDYGNEEAELNNDIELADEWPFYIEKEQGSDEYYEYTIGKGNAGLFLGNEYVHYRLPLKKNHYSMSMLMHFIPEEFKGKVL